MKSKVDLIAFVAGLILFSAGLALAWLPLGLIGPGIVLMAAAVFDPPRRESQ